MIALIDEHHQTYGDLADTEADTIRDIPLARRQSPPDRAVFNRPKPRSFQPALTPHSGGAVRCSIGEGQGRCSDLEYTSHDSYHSQPEVVEHRDRGMPSNGFSLGDLRTAQPVAYRPGLSG